MNATESLPPGNPAVARRVAGGGCRGQWPPASAAPSSLPAAPSSPSAVLIAVLLPTDRSLDWSTAVVATIALGLSSMVVFEVGSVSHRRRPRSPSCRCCSSCRPAWCRCLVRAGLLPRQAAASIFAGRRPRDAACTRCRPIRGSRSAPTLVLIGRGHRRSPLSSYLARLPGRAGRPVRRRVAGRSSVRERLHGGASRARAARREPRGSTSSTRSSSPYRAGWSPSRPPIHSWVVCSSPLAALRAPAHLRPRAEPSA